jgi:hypothetical protein
MILFRQFFSSLWVCICDLHICRFIGMRMYIVSKPVGIRGWSGLSFLLFCIMHHCRITQSNPEFAALLSKATSWGLELQACEHCHQAWGSDSYSTCLCSKLLTTGPSPQPWSQQVSISMASIWKGKDIHGSNVMWLHANVCSISIVLNTPTSASSIKPSVWE